MSLLRIPYLSPYLYFHLSQHMNQLIQGSNITTRKYDIPRIKDQLHNEKFAWNTLPRQMFIAFPCKFLQREKAVDIIQYITFRVLLRVVKYFAEQ